jgi:hypothetical protein
MKMGIKIRRGVEHSHFYSYLHPNPLCPIHSSSPFQRFQIVEGSALKGEEKRLFWWRRSRRGLMLEGRTALLPWCRYPGLRLPIPSFSSDLPLSPSRLLSWSEYSVCFEDMAIWHLGPSRVHTGKPICRSGNLRQVSFDWIIVMIP